MKKIVLLIGVIAVVLCMGLGAVACSNVNQINFISVVARDYERYTYTVYEQLDDEAKTLQPIGTYVYTFRRLLGAGENGTVEYTVNGATYSFHSGGVIETELTITDGDYAGETVTTEVLFQNAFTPIASHKVYQAVTKGDPDEARSYESAIDYTAKKQVSITVNGKTSSFKKPSYCFDNDSLYSVVRGSDITRSSYSLSVAGVDNLQGGTRSVSIAITGTAITMEVPAISAEPQAVTGVMLATRAQYGASTACYIYFVQSCRHTDSHGRAIDLNKVPVRMDEGRYTYRLTDLSTEE